MLREITPILGPNYSDVGRKSDEELRAVALFILLDHERKYQAIPN